jgi:hypothetical protein
LLDVAVTFQALDVVPTIAIDLVFDGFIARWPLDAVNVVAAIPALIPLIAALVVGAGLPVVV